MVAPPRRARRPVSTALFVIGFGLVLATALPARAHSVLEASTPEPGATVSSLATIRLEFAEPLAPDAEQEVVLSTIDDRFVDTSDVRVDGSVITLDVGGMPAQGEYLLMYTVTPGDGHAQDGGFVFAYDGPVSTPSPWRAVAGTALVVLGGALLLVRARLTRRPARALA